MASTRARLSTLALLAVLAGGHAVTAAGELPLNPIFPGADPHALVVGKEVWIYPTCRTGRRGPGFLAFSSRDLKTWQRHGPVLEFRDVRWIGDDGQKRHHAWAPAVAERDGKYYFYYSVGPQGVTPSRIGVGVGDSPAGPFKDSGKPLLAGGKGFEAIDPMVFGDPKSGTYYFYVGGSAGRRLRVFEMNRDMVSFAREIEVKTPRHFTEAPFLHVREGVYPLSYSRGRWNRASYSVHYATAASPTGPWTHRGAILTSSGKRKGPGHHSIIRHPVTKEWLIVYHRWEGKVGNGPYRGSRQVCIDRLVYDDQGLLRPVKMTGGKGTGPTGPPQ
ncbi:MAG: family 43 glycosylhydrolase [Victivallales bacterium]|nr:family 43 glycosylhydrolase [Victivallales bacterium]